jgi:HAMP domain-containing protein
MGILGLLAIAVIGITSYKLSVKNAMDEAKIKSNIILNYAMATKDYMSQVQKPLVQELIEKDRFYPELMSGFVSARGTFEIFKKSFPGYTFKQATLDPLNPSSKADQNEIEFIKTFDQNPTLKSSEGQITKNGADFFYFAQPVKINSKGCLKCHGDPYDAPKDQIEIYGTETGYNWKMDDTVAAFVVYIPTADAIAAAKKLSFTLILVGAAGIIVILLILWFFLDRSVVLPITKLSQRTDSFSLGEDLDEPITGKSNDEIGTLAQAIERLRISLVKLLK